MIRVVLVEDHEIVRTGIRLILENMQGIEIVGECGDGEQAIQAARELQPNVMLMDVNMPKISGIEATRRIVNADQGIRIIILTVHAENPFPKQLLDAGASGYLTKGCESSELEKAIRRVHAGGKYVGADIAQQMALSMLPGAGNDSPFDVLSNREMEVMMMVIQGKRAKEIGFLLNLNEKTVATYKYRLLEKLDLKNEVQLTKLAIRHGILEESTL